VRGSRRFREPLAVGVATRRDWRKGGGFYGYKIHAAVCAQTGLPLAWEVETGRRNESLYVAPLLDAVLRSLRRVPRARHRPGDSAPQGPVRSPRRRSSAAPPRGETCTAAVRQSSASSDV